MDEKKWEETRARWAEEDKEMAEAQRKLEESLTNDVNLK